LGNHDDREHLIQGIQNHLGVTKSASPAPQSGSSVVSGKRVAKVRGAFCDWYLLDSLEHTNKTPGLLGTAQMQWLDAQLSAEPHRAALVMMHHNPHLHAELIQTGLRDTDELIDLLVSHAQVKALFFGHTHVAKTAVHRELHLINLPACAYRFRGAEPTGWTRALIDSSGCSLELFDTAQSHALHGKTIRLAWRPT
jgi:3',5'-cyclic AMP phosphodiesterase CpdA